MEWKLLERVDPFGEKREDYRNAHLCAQLANLMAPRKGQPYRAEDFLLEFKDATQVAEEQTQEQIEAMIKTWVAAANIQARLEKKTKAKSAA